MNEIKSKFNELKTTLLNENRTAKESKRFGGGDDTVKVAILIFQSGNSIFSYVHRVLRHFEKIYIFSEHQEQPLMVMYAY